MRQAFPWVAHYDVGVPATLAPYPSRTLVDVVGEVARTHPTSPAILFKGATLTYAELNRLSDSFAAGLIGLGVQRGERVALVLPNCPQFVIAELGAWKAGAVVAPLNPLYPEHELEGPLARHGVETIVTLTRYYTRIKRVQPRTPLRRVIATNIKEYFPPLLRFLFTWFREAREGDRVTIEPGDHAWGDVIAPKGPPPRDAAARPEEPAVLLMSGGTTGLPKGVIGTHQAYVTAGLQIESWVHEVLHPGDSVIMLPLPLFHVYGNVGVQSLAFQTRNAMALVPNPRDLPDLLKTIGRVKPAFFNGVPTLYIALLNRPEVQKGQVDFKSIRICFSGAAPLMADTKSRFESLTGGRIVEGYSLTEAMMALCINPVAGANKTGSVGMPLPDVRVCIVDADTGLRELGTGEVGEICIAAPQLMSGFWEAPEETAAVIREHLDADGTNRLWLHTGDLGYLDPDGYVFIVDRKKDLIKTSGNQVWPREVEEVLAAHPAVAEVGVAGVPDALKGEAVQAWVVLRQGQNASEADLRSYCHEQLAPYKVPSRILFRSELPKTLVGKVLRRALREDTDTAHRR